MKKNDFEALAKSCGYIPAATEVLGEVFAKYQFVMGGVYMSASEVFNENGLMPVLVFLASDRIKQLRGTDFSVDHRDNEESVVGFSANLVKESSAAEKTLFLLVTQSIAKELFGEEPSADPINLDELYEWVFNPVGAPPRILSGYSVLNEAELSGS